MQSVNTTAVVDETVADIIKTFTITNRRGTRLTACNLGAAVMSLFVKDKEGHLADVVLGYDDPLQYKTDEYYIGTVVGRYANRIATGSVVIDGQAYRIAVKEGGYHLHGGVEGFNKKIFAAKTFEQENKSGIVFTYTSADMEEGFPGELQLEVIYILDDEDRWTIEYKAVSSKTTIINLTQHTYFNLSGNLSTTIHEHELQLLAEYYLPVTPMQVPTGELQKVAGTVFDFSHFKTIGKDIHQPDEQLERSGGYDHSFVLEQHHTPALKQAAMVKEISSGRTMEVYTTEPAVHFYSGNFLENVKGKNGIIYNRRAGFCLETQHFPDAPNQPHFPATVLHAGEEFYSKTIFKFSAE